MLAPFASRRGSTSRRAISRSRRFSRVRSAAECRCSGTTQPTREKFAGEAESKTSSEVVLLRFPRRNRDLISVPREIRRARGSRKPRPRRELGTTFAFYFPPTFTVSCLRP